MLRCVGQGLASWSVSLASSTGDFSLAGIGTASFGGASVATAMAIGGYTYEGAAPAASYPLLLGARRGEPTSVNNVLGSSIPVATFRVGGTTAPINGQDVQLDFGDSKGVLFAGRVQNVRQVTSSTKYCVWDITVVEYLWVLASRCPYGCWTEVSATAVVQALVAGWAPDFTTANVEASLPLVTVVFTGAKTLVDCLGEIAQQIGSCYFYVDFDKDVHFFQNDPTDPPDDLVDSNPKFLLDIPPEYERDDSQIRNRVSMLGASTTLAADAPAGATVIEIDSGVYFSDTGLVASGCQRFTALGTFSTSVSPARPSGPNVNEGGRPAGGTVGFGGGGVWPGAFNAAQALSSAPPYTVPAGKIHVATRYAVSTTDAAGNESQLSDIVQTQQYVTWNISDLTTSSSDLTPTTGGSVPQGVVLRYAIARVDANGGVSNLRIMDASVTLGGSDTAVAFTIHAATDTRIAGSVIFRTRSNGSTFFLVGTFAGRGAGVFTDTKADADLVQQAADSAFGPGTPQRYNSTGVLVDLTNLPGYGFTRKIYRSTGDAYSNANAWSPFRLIATLDGATVTYRDEKETPRQDQVDFNLSHGLSSDGGPAAQTTGGGPSSGPTTGEPPGDFPAITHTYLRVSGLSEPLSKGSTIWLFYQGDNLESQRDYAARAGGDGVREKPTVTDESLTSYAALARRVYAELQTFAGEIETLRFLSTDTKMKIGKPLVVNITHPKPITTTLQIQSVSIDIAKYCADGVLHYHVVAGSVKFSWQDFMRSTMLAAL